MQTRVWSWDDLTTWDDWVTWLYQEVSPVVPNHFDAGGLIAARVQAQCPLARQVNAIASFRLVPSLMQFAPAVFIAPGPEDVPNDDPYGVSQVTEQNWYVYVIARNVTATEYGQAALDEAGMLTSQVLAALQGWKPSARHTELRRRRAQLPEYQPGEVMVPLMFSTVIINVGSANVAA